MKFTVEVSGLLAAVDPILDVATKHTMKDFVGTGKINIESDKTLRFSAFNGLMSATKEVSDIDAAEMSYACETYGEICVPAKEFYNAVQSFASGSLLEIEVKEKDGIVEMLLSPQNDPDQIQTVLCQLDLVELPEAADTFTKQLEMNRGMFVYGVGKIDFAIGYEEQREQYLYWVLRAKKDSARFVAGTGGMFAILDMESKDLIQSKEDVDFLFPKEQTAVLQKILSSHSKADKITIEESDPNSKSPFQLVITSGSIKMTIVAMNPNIRWVNEEDFLQAKYGFKTIMKVKDWDYAGRGIIATFDDELRREKKPHKAIVDFDFKKDFVKVETHGSMRSKRKVKLVDSVSSKDACRFACDSTYLGQIAQKAPDDCGNVQIELNDSSETSEGRSKSDRVVLVNYFAADKVSTQTPQRVNASLGISESFRIFFAKKND